jgi:hypothetical protein
MVVARKPGWRGRRGSRDLLLVVVDGMAHLDLLLDGWRLFTVAMRVVRRDLASTGRSLSREATTNGEERAPMDRQVEVMARTDPQAKT